MNKEIIEQRAIQTLKDVLKKVDGWPVLEEEKWNEANFDWTTLTLKFNNLGFEALPFIDFGIGNDFGNSSVRIIEIDQPRFGISRELLVKGKDDKIVGAYFVYMVDVAVELGCDKTKAESELKDSLEFEIEMAKLAMSKLERRNITKLYNVMTIGDLEKNYPGVSWLKFINELLPRKIQVERNESLILGSPHYLSSLINLLDITPKRTQANYAIWRGISSQISYLTKNLQDRRFDFKSILIGQTVQAPRWKHCINDVSTNLPILTSALYVRRYFHEDAKKAIVELVQHIKETVVDMLKNVKWMDKETRQNALDKALAIVGHIGYPDELLNDTKLDEVFNSLEVHPDYYLQSHMNTTIHTLTYLANRLRKTVNKTDWVDHGDVAQVNAFYHPLENSISLPAGILQGIYFNKDRPNYMNYAAIGSVIGHELTHGFDDTGRQFDKDGNFIDWWAAETKKSFLIKAQCIIDQYGNYTIFDRDKKLNGIITQGENIADNGGIKEAYIAYNAWAKKNGPEQKLPGLQYTPNQLFWITGAMNWCSKYRPEALELSLATDTHSVPEFRVIGPFSNTEYFAKDFKCPFGSRMNPKIKCSVW